MYDEATAPTGKTVGIACANCSHVITGSETLSQHWHENPECGVAAFSESSEEKQHFEQLLAMKEAERAARRNKEPRRVVVHVTDRSTRKTTLIGFSYRGNLHERINALKKKYDDVVVLSTADDFVYYTSNSDFGLTL